MELHLERNKGLKLNVPVVYGKEMKVLLRGAVEEEVGDINHNIITDEIIPICAELYIK